MLYPIICEREFNNKSKEVNDGKSLNESFTYRRRLLLCL